VYTGGIRVKINVTHANLNSIVLKKKKPKAPKFILQCTVKEKTSSNPSPGLTFNISSLLYFNIFNLPWTGIL
jgi:hypothetical protein